MTKIFLHIGTNKTGTSAIQHFFEQNREALKKEGVLYPITGCTGSAHYGLSTALAFAHGRKSQDITENDLIGLKNGLKNEIESSSPKAVLFSSENFVIPRQIEKVKEFFQDYDVRIVVYLRRHDSWWESVYNQAVKMVANPPWGKGIKSYIEFSQIHTPNYGNYKVLVDRWGKVFGKENIIVCPYEKQQNKADIALDLLSAIGMGSIAQNLSTQTDRKNESLSFLSLSLIDIYQRADIEPEIRSKLIKYAQSINDAKPTKSIIPPDLRRELVERNLADYEYIAKEYMGRKNGILFYDPLPDPNERWRAPRHPSWANVVEHTLFGANVSKIEPKLTSANTASEKNPTSKTKAK